MIHKRSTALEHVERPVQYISSGGLKLVLWYQHFMVPTSPLFQMRIKTNRRFQKVSSTDAYVAKY